MNFMIEVCPIYNSQPFESTNETNG